MNKQPNKPEKFLRVRLDTKHQRLLDRLTEHFDLDWSKVVRLALRELAKREKLQ